MTAPPGITFAGRAVIGGTPLFADLSFEALAGQWTCLLGASGVGKSTILRLIAGLETGAQFAGEIRATDGAAVSGRIAFMAQQDLLFPWLDVMGNVLVGARLRGAAPDRDRAREMIRQVGLEGHAGKRPGQLSGGMRQRAALARTLMEDRPLVLLDEPFSALDAGTRAEMQDLAAGLLAGRTVVMVTHDPAEAARLGHAILMMTGQGITPVLPPDVAPIRAYDDPAVFECQTRLMGLIRGAA